MTLPLFRGEPSEITQRTSWYAFVRLLFLLVIALPGLLALYIFHGWNTESLRDVILLLIALASNALFYGLILINPHPTYQRILAGIWIGIDILLITFLIAANGGIESRIMILYVMPILMAAAIFGRLATYLAAALSAVMYAGLIVGDYLGFMPVTGRYDTTLHTDLPYVVSTIAFFVSVFAVTALAIDSITKLLIRKEHEAQESLTALQRAQQLARIGSWEWDLAHDEITWSDELAKVLHTYHAKPPLRYEQYMQFVHPDDRKAHLKTLESALKKRKPFASNYRLVMPNGSAKYVHSEGTPLLDRSGNIMKMFGIAQDVTDMYHLDDAKREFVSLASHQLRTPASGVKAFLSLLLDGYIGTLTRRQRQFVKKAYEANDRQLDIIDNLLSVASIESGKFVLHKEPVDLNAIIRNCLPHHRLEAKEKKQKLSIKLRRAPITILADASHFQMAIDNLISNAIKYTPEHGTIAITSHIDPKAGYVNVVDSGIGIARGDLPLLFQKFSRLSDPTSKTVGGSGLGLYLTKYIVSLHRGTIKVTSRKGEGTDFRIKVPLVKKQG